MATTITILYGEGGWLPELENGNVLEIFEEIVDEATGEVATESLDVTDYVDADGYPAEG